MPKTRDEKKKVLDQLSKDLTDDQVVIFVDYQGIDSQGLQKLREELKAQKAKFRIAKNSLLGIALNKAKIEVDKKMLLKPIAISVSKDIGPAKIFKDFAKEQENLEILGGIYQNEYQDQSFIEKLAIIPSREELLAKLVAQLKAPQYGFVWALKGNLLKLLYILKKKSEVKK